MKKCRENKFKEALPILKESENLFRKVGNLLEAEMIGLYVSYSLLNSGDLEKSLLKAENTARFANEKNYKWLYSSALYRIADSQANLARYTVAIKNLEKSYAAANDLQDLYAMQRTALFLSSLHSRLGQKREAMNYIYRVFGLMSENPTSVRQKLRNYFGSVEVFSSLELNEIAKIVALETISAGQELGDPGSLSLGQTQAAIVYTKTKDYEMSRKLLEESFYNAEKMQDERAKKNLMAYALLKRAYLENQTENFNQAAEFFRQSKRINNLPYFEYESDKGLLLADLALRNDFELEKQIPLTIKNAELNRKNILEEQQKNSFFESEQSVYDIAVEWEFSRGNHEKSYDYAELSNARSLLDSIEDSSKTRLYNEQANPLKLIEIQKAMPQNVQILQYTVLEKKILVWLITKEKFVTKEVKIASSDLEKKIDRYVKLIVSGNKTDQTESAQLAKDLYNLLINPIKENLEVDKEICLIPNRILFSLPFQTLISPDNKYFLTEYAMFYAPSANVFILCTKNAERKTSRTESVLSVGNPAFDKRAFSELSDLPNSETEAREIADLYDESKILLGKEATKQEFKKSIRNTEVIHFAGHYLVRSGLPSSSSLIFASVGEKIEDGILTNEELVNEKLSNTKLVILAACETGVESYYKGEGMIGLSRTFLKANTPLVVASQWKADTDATAQLMKKMHYYRRQEKLSTVAALRRAQIEMVDANDERFKKPYFWAAFSVFGGYAKY